MSEEIKVYINSNEDGFITDCYFADNTKVSCEFYHEESEIEYSNCKLLNLQDYIKEKDQQIVYLQSQLDQANEKIMWLNAEIDTLKSEKENLMRTLEEASEELECAIELPVKLGDTIYVVPSRTNYQINIINNKEEKNKVSEFVVDEIRYNKYGYSIVCYIDYIPFYFNYETAKGYCEHFNTEKFYGETWFTTFEEAEKKLQELKGE